MMFVPRPRPLDGCDETGDHHRYTICHYVVFPNTVFNNNPDQIQLFQPIPLAVDRTRFICWELVYDAEGDDDPEYERTSSERDGPLDRPQGRRRRGPLRVRPARPHPALDGLPAQHLQQPRVQADGVPPHDGPAASRAAHRWTAGPTSPPAAGGGRVDRRRSGDHRRRSVGRDALVASTAAIQRATRDDEAGCLVYCFAADPVHDDLIQVYELWADESALAAHFDHPNYHAMRDLLNGAGLVSAVSRKLRIDAAAPVSGEDRRPSAGFPA